ncbi:hypothetical protein [Pandoraea pulmonicola]|uniref:Uncharacterized protein n=1 Tax=Pandoraea pulmonicola TaxID=93221 RepID=A0AAJ4ZAM5_PANPU|nr:hypothetical protein [Pandoraea pulmonicola]AJC21504.1 hypothetical protein RO07_15240 [Pandoraea pulmonicola]SUA89716.1 Uncharacterised protein [Pandoraea pulmonicola]
MPPSVKIPRQETGVSGGSAKITDDMLREWVALGRAGILAAGGINGLAKQYNVSAGALRNYLRADGTLTQQGQNRLNPGGRVEITGDMLQQWTTLGREGIKAAGGLEGLARRNNVSVVALRNCLRVDSTLTQYGQERVDRGRKAEVTDDMLRRWRTLGPEEIHAAGGINGLARQHNVSIVALRTYLHADGTLRQCGEDRLNPDGKVEISIAMLRQWATLGPEGFKAAGGIEGLARRHNVSAGALKAHFRINGTLSSRGEKRLRKAGMLPM